MKKTVKTNLINCIVLNHKTQSVEIIPFSTAEESAEFCNMIMECHKNVEKVFNGNECEVQFDKENQTINLFSHNDNKVIFEIRVDVHHDFEVTGEVVED